jgi:hypothetical protein
MRLKVVALIETNLVLDNFLLNRSSLLIVQKLTKGKSSIT